MPDETTAALQEIAGLLRRRVEQQDEMAKRSEENMARIEERRSGPNAVERIHEEGAQRRAEMMAKMERQSEQGRQEKERLLQERERLHQEQRQFQERLLAEMERHNALLERLLSRLA